MPRFGIKRVSELEIGEWAQVNGKWTMVRGCATGRDGWTHLDLKDWPISSMTMHQSVEVPWSPTMPEGAS